MTTYTALSNRIRAAETRQELAKREEQITRHYHRRRVFPPGWENNGKDIFYSRHYPDKPHNTRTMTTLFYDDYTGPRYTYGLRNRPLCLGTAPKGYIIGSDGEATGRARWGTIQYPRPLTPQEIYDYELEVMDETDTLPTNPTIPAP